MFNWIRLSLQESPGKTPSGEEAVNRVGSGGNSYDNALAETIIGLYETEEDGHKQPSPH